MGMKVYAMFVRLSTYDLNGGWRFEGFTMNEHTAQGFIAKVQEDIINTNSDNTLLTKTLAYEVVELDM